MTDTRIHVTVLRVRRRLTAFAFAFVSTMKIATPTSATAQGATARVATATSASANAILSTRHLLRADSLDEAERTMRAAIEAEPLNSMNHLWMAAVYTEEGSRISFFRQFFLARHVRAELERAVALDDQSIDARSELARYYLTAPAVLGGSFTRATEEARKLAATSPSRSHGLLGYIAHHRGEPVVAERELRAAVALAPDSAWGHTGLAFLLGEQERYDEAFSNWQESVQLDSTLSDSYYQMGVIGATTGTHLADAARALEYYLAHPVRPSDLKDRARASNKLGLVYEKQGRRDDARRAYQQATTWAPSSRTYKESVARVAP